MSNIDFSELTQRVVDEECCPLEALALIKERIKFLTECLNQVKPVAEKEADLYEKNFQKSGFEFEKRKGRVVYDFSGIKRWSEKKQEIKDIELIAKTAFKNYEKGIQCATEDGEEIELPKTTYTPDTLVIRRVSNKY